MGMEISSNFSINMGGGMGGLDPLNLFGGNDAPAGNQQGQNNGMTEDAAKHLMSLCQQACGSGQGAGGGAQGKGGCGGAEGGEGAQGGEGAKGGGIQQILELLMKLIQMLAGGAGAQGGAATQTAAAQPTA